ncbi:MAG: hypothetical protein HDS62_09485 [Bacteroidales bacterium]|nr:hypothetical protein [Bacteroidales bacterium]
MEDYGYKVTECSCDKCKNQCRTPCLGTPEDIDRLIRAGYGDRLAPTLWGAGILIGCTNKIIKLIAPKQEDNGWCAFRTSDGLCELHDKGLKPTEGKLTHHSNPLKVSPNRNLTWLIAKEWLPYQEMFNQKK